MNRRNRRIVFNKENRVGAPCRQVTSRNRSGREASEMPRAPNKNVAIRFLRSCQVSDCDADVIESMPAPENGQLRRILGLLLGSHGQLGNTSEAKPTEN